MLIVRWSKVACTCAAKNDHWVGTVFFSQNFVFILDPAETITPMRDGEHWACYPTGETSLGPVTVMPVRFISVVPEEVLQSFCGDSEFEALPSLPEIPPSPPRQPRTPAPGRISHLRIVR